MTRLHGSAPDRLEGCLVPFLVMLMVVVGLAIALVDAALRVAGWSLWAEDGGWF